MYKCKSGESVHLPYISAKIPEKTFKSSENVKTRGKTKESDDVIAAKLIRNKINEQLLLESQGLSGSQEGDLVHFAKSSGNATETKR